VSTLVDTWIHAMRGWIEGENDENEIPFIFPTLPIPVVGRDLA
jgi:hypothetical protein